MKHAMKKRKSAAALLLAAMMLATGMPVQAEETLQAAVGQDVNISSGMAVEIARNLLGGLPEFDMEPQVNAFDFPANREKGYNIVFKRPVAGHGDDLITVMIGAGSGHLLAYHRDNPEYATSVRPSDETAKQVAEAFLSAMAPDLKGRLHLRRIATGNDSKAAVIYEELVDGIPFESNGVTIEVDGEGHVVHMLRSFRYDSSKLPPAFLAIKPEQAQAAYLKELQLGKFYTTRSMQRDEKGEFRFADNISLGYHPLSIPMIDALTGKPVQQDGWWYTQRTYSNAKPQKIMGEGLVWTVKSKADVPKVVGELYGVDFSTWDAAEMPEKLGGEQNIIWRWLDKESSKVALATYNVDHNRIISVSYVDDVEQMQGQPAFTVEEGVAKASELLKPYLPKGEQDVFLIHTLDQSKHQGKPDWFDDKRTQLLAPEHVYTYMFSVAHQGVPVRDWSYTVRIDAASGKLLGLKLPFLTDVKLPDNQNTLTPEQAAQAFLGDAKPQLRYFWTNYAGQDAPFGSLRYVVEARSDYGSYIDAFTGKAVEFYN